MTRERAAAVASSALAYVKARWPVSSGQSRDAWEARVLVSGESFEVSLVNTLPYARFVRRAGAAEHLAPVLAVEALQQALQEAS